METVMKDQDREPDRLRDGAYVLVAVIAFLIGLILGTLSGPPTGGSRVGWPPPPSNPRSLNP